MKQTIQTQEVEEFRIFDRIFTSIMDREYILRTLKSIPNAKVTEDPMNSAGFGSIHITVGESMNTETYSLMYGDFKLYSVHHTKSVVEELLGKTS